MHRTRIRLLTVASACLWSACSSAPPAPMAPATPTATKTSMSSPTLSARRPFEALLHALKDETLLASGHVDTARLNELFGAHQLKSSTSELKPELQKLDLRFPDGFVLKLSHGPSSRNTKPSVGFASSQAQDATSHHLDLLADDLVRLIGQPETVIDIRAGRLGTLDEDDKVDISPQPLLLRGKTTHPLGNTDLTWRLKTNRSSVLIGAEILGNGTVAAFFGQQSED